MDKKSVFARYKKPLLNLFLVVNDLSKFFSGLFYLHSLPMVNYERTKNILDLRSKKLNIPHFWISCLILKLRKYIACITKYTRVMINSTGELPQFIIIPVIDRELKDRFLYRNKFQTG